MKLDLSIIKTLCRQKGVTVKEFALELGFSDASVNRTIKNNATTVDFLEKAANYFNVGVDVFFGGQSKATEILAILDSAFADDKKRTDDILTAVNQAAKVFDDMQMNDDPKLRKKFLQYQRKQFKSVIGNIYVEMLMRLGSAELGKLVGLGYISEELRNLIEVTKVEVSKIENGGTK
jgi:transcriptional regulator with XRE-family HTH domain